MIETASWKISSDKKNEPNLATCRTVSSTTGARDGALRHHRSWVGKAVRTAGAGWAIGGRRDT